MTHHLLTLALLVGATAHPGHAGAADLRVLVENVASSEGEVRAAAYSSAETFLKRPAASAVAPAASAVGGKIELRFVDLPAGSYAVSVFHDRNSNRKLDTNSLGIPVEPNGMSRDARGAMGPPSFDDSKFELREAAVLVRVKLNR